MIETKSPNIYEIQSNPAGFKIIIRKRYHDTTISVNITSIIS